MTTVFTASAAMDEASIRERLKPVGKVSVEGEIASASSSDTASDAAASTAVTSRSGSDIYQTSCIACHGSGVLQAPKLGDAAAWTERLAKGMDAVVANAINGINAMPPRGTCGGCSDEELAATVQYMVDSSK
jgi:cytochrome c5